MRCPRCESAFDEAAVCCPACGAPLRLPDEPPPVALNRSLDLDRRRSRTPVPASTPPPRVAGDEEGDLGDLSFDPPADDGPWTMAAPAPVEDEPEPRPAVFAPSASAGPVILRGTGPDFEIDPGDGEDRGGDENAAEGDPAACGDAEYAGAEDGGAEYADAEDGGAEYADAEDGDAEYAAADDDHSEDAEDAGDAEAAEDADDSEDADVGEDDAPGVDQAAVRRGRALSLASVAIAGAAVLVAVLSWR